MKSIFLSIAALGMLALATSASTSLAVADDAVRPGVPPLQSNVHEDVIVGQGADQGTFQEVYWPRYGYWGGPRYYGTYYGGYYPYRYYRPYYYGYTYPYYGYYDYGYPYYGGYYYNYPYYTARPGLGLYFRF